MKQTKLDDGVKHLAIDEADLILTNWVEGVDAKYVNGFKDLRNYPVDQPVAFRGMLLDFFFLALEACINKLN